MRHSQVKAETCSIQWPLQMLSQSRFSARPVKPNAPFGAREITEFRGRAANDNPSLNGASANHRTAGVALPIIAFVCGLGGAAMVTLAGHLFGLAS
jgi:hypothetical protein